MQVERPTLKSVAKGVIMNRKFLANLGITDDELIGKILNAHQGVAQPLKDDIDTLKSDLAAARADLKKAQEPPEGATDWEKKYNEEASAHAATKEAMQKAVGDEIAAHKATKDGYAAEKDAADIDQKVSAALKAAGMNEKAIPKALKLYDRSMVKRDKEGAISNADKVVEHFKGEWGDFFSETKTIGADVGTPPINNPTGSYTKADIERMSAAEINANWDQIKPVLAGD